jgi:CheY-like chemotaxis protein
VKVLVIDDSETARDLMTRVLSPFHTVFSLPSPIGATRTILSRNVDVVVVDVNLPGFQGDSLARLFRRNERMYNLGLVLVSGMDEDQLARLARDADAYVTKNDVVLQLAGCVLQAKKKRAA